MPHGNSDPLRASLPGTTELTSANRLSSPDQRKVAFRQVRLPQCFSEKAGWLIQRLVRKTESAPMGRDEEAVFRRRACAADLEVGGNRILGTHMHGLHEPARLISADGENRRVKGSSAARIVMYRCQDY